MPTVTAEMRHKLADADRYEARMRREHPDAPPEAFALMLWFCVDGRRVAERGPDPLARVGDDAFVDWKNHYAYRNGKHIVRMQFWKKTDPIGMHPAVVMEAAFIPGMPTLTTTDHFALMDAHRFDDASDIFRLFDDEAFFIFRYGGNEPTIVPWEFKKHATQHEPESDPDDASSDWSAPGFHPAGLPRRLGRRGCQNQGRWGPLRDPRR